MHLILYTASYDISCSLDVCCLLTSATGRYHCLVFLPLSFFCCMTEGTVWYSSSQTQIWTFRYFDKWPDFAWSCQLISCNKWGCMLGDLLLIPKLESGGCTFWDYGPTMINLFHKRLWELDGKGNTQYAFIVKIYVFILDNMKVCMCTKPFLRIHLSNIFSSSCFFWCILSSLCKLPLQGGQSWADNRGFLHALAEVIFPRWLVQWQSS